MLTCTQTTIDPSPPQIRKKKKKQDKQHQSRKGLIGSTVIQVCRTLFIVNFRFIHIIYRNSEILAV